MKKTALLLLLALGAQAQDKGEFVDHSNPFYGEIMKASKAYDRGEHEAHSAFKMDMSDLELPQSLEEFTIVEVEDPISQGNTGTCWCFSTTSFYESEIYRMQGKSIDLSELYTVYFEYIEKAREYVQTRGESHLGEGSETNAVQRMMDLYGIVPQEAYAGKPADQPFYNHAPMFKELKEYLSHCQSVSFWDEDAILSNVKSILNHYMGEPPASFL
jgi:bleomycin hydrolase